MQRSSFLRALSLCLGVLVGCGADDPSMAFPEDDAAVEQDGAVVEMARFHALQIIWLAPKAKQG